MWTIKRFPALWLLPALLPVALMTIYPVANALWTSLHSVMLLFPGEPFVGLENYQRVVSSNYFQDALRNSLVFTLLAAPLVVTIGTLIALFLQRRFFGSQVVRSIVTGARSATIARPGLAALPIIQKIGKRKTRVRA